MFRNVDGKTIILDAFADDAAKDRKQIDLNGAFHCLETLGIRFWTPRFAYNPRSGRNDNLNTTRDTKWLKEVKKAAEGHGLSVISMGTPLLKCRVRESDAQSAPYMTIEQVREQARTVIENAHEMGAVALRGFSCYRQRESAANLHTASIDPLAINYVNAVAHMCQEGRLLYVVEPETGLNGNSAAAMIQIQRSTGLENIVFLTDPANLHLQGLNAVSESQELLNSGRLVGMHAKFYGQKIAQGIVPSQESAAVHHVPISRDASRFSEFMQQLANQLFGLNAQITVHRSRGYALPGFFITYEPHLAGAGQFGGISKPRGLGLAHEAMVLELQKNSIGYTTINFDEFRRIEGLPPLLRG